MEEGNKEHKVASHCIHLYNTKRVRMYRKERRMWALLFERHFTHNSMIAELPSYNKKRKLDIRFKKVCVFCGSSSGNRKIFSDAALDLGREPVERKIDLVYGGASIGLMGLVSQAVYDGNCHVLGIIPVALIPTEISGQTVGEVRTVSSMHERKTMMAKESDAFIALPGGYGTMEELLEMITWLQLGIHNKPVGLLNVDGYYNSLLALFDNGVEEGFINPAARNIFQSAPTARELMEKMENFSLRQ